MLTAKLQKLHYKMSIRKRRLYIIKFENSHKDVKFLYQEYHIVCYILNGSINLAITPTM